MSGVGLPIARIANHFDRQEQHEGLKNLEREAKVLRGNVYQWVRTQPPIPPKFADYKGNIGLKTKPTGRLAFRTTLILLAQAASIVGQFRRAATHSEEHENNIWFWLIILFDVFILIASVLKAHYQKDNLKNASNNANAELQQLKFIAAHGQGSQSAAAAAFEREVKEQRSSIVRAYALTAEKEKMELKGEESEQGQPFIKKRSRATKNIPVQCQFI